MIRRYVEIKLNLMHSNRGLHCTAPEKMIRARVMSHAFPNARSTTVWLPKSMRIGGDLCIITRIAGNAAQRIGTGHMLQETAAAYAMKFKMYDHALRLLQVSSENWNAMRHLYAIVVQSIMHLSICPCFATSHRRTLRTNYGYFDACN